MKSDRRAYNFNYLFIEKVVIMWIQPIDYSGQSTFVACVQEKKKGVKIKLKNKDKNP